MEEPPVQAHAPDGVTLPEPHEEPAAPVAEADSEPDGPPRLIRVRATIHLPGLRRGEEVLVDATLPYERDCLEAGYLVRV